MFVAVSNPLDVIAGDFPFKGVRGIQHPCDAVVIKIGFPVVKGKHGLRDR